MNTIIPSNDSNNILTEHVALRLTGLNFALEGGTGTALIPNGAFTPWIDVRNWTEVKLFINTGNVSYLAQDIRIQYCLDPSSGIIIQVGDLSTTDANPEPSIHPQAGEKVWESPIPPYIRFIHLPSVSTDTKNAYINISGRKKIKTEAISAIPIPAYTDVGSVNNIIKIYL